MGRATTLEGREARWASELRRRPEIHISSTERIFVVRTAIRALLLTSLTLACQLGMPSAARSDEYTNLIRVTCLPEIDYFAFETFGLDNLYRFGLEYESYGGWTDFAEAEWTELAERHGIHELSHFAKAPYECRLPNKDIVVEIRGYVGPRAFGECGGIGRAKVRISVNGAIVTEHDNTHGGCPRWINHEVHVSTYELRHCVREFGGANQTAEGEPTEFSPIEAYCRTIEMPWQLP